MKLQPGISKRQSAGLLLLDCMVYVAVFFVMLGIATAAFIIFWDHSTALLGTTNDISATLRAGERWRADVRAATGKISIETNSAGALLTIPFNQDKIFYSFHDGMIHRKSSSQNFSQMLLEKVKASEIEMDARNNVTAWRWELELQPRPKQKPLAFTFEAATTLAP
jgi:hypothetical protein